jgi:signal transduction histidine kinase
MKSTPEPSQSSYQLGPSRLPSPFAKRNKSDDLEELNTRAFSEELRYANLPLLFWTIVIFNPVYLAWTGFDFLLQPNNWTYFFALRLSAFVIILVVAIFIFLLGYEKYTWEGFWIIVFVYVFFVALMLPRIENQNFLRYIMGLSMVIFGAGLIPIWRPKWLISVLLGSLSCTLYIFIESKSGSFPFVGDLVASGFVVTTSVGFAVVGSIFKFDAARRDYVSRLNMAAVVKKETEARVELSETSAELQNALERLKEVDRLKSQFFANVSHELRTPLTLILAPLDDLISRMESATEQRQLDVVRRNAVRLLGLIDDLLDLSRLDAGGLRLNLAEIDLRTVLQTVHENSQPAAVAKKLDFTIDIEKSERTVWGDAHRLEIVFSNLVSNAIKFTPEGGRVSLCVFDRSGGVFASVRDDGPGIPASDISHVFERFYQVSPSDRRRGGGVGIGLALAKELVELHGGVIEVESEPGTFTEFSVFIPFGKSHIRPEVVERRMSFDAGASERRRGDDRAAVYASGGAETFILSGESVETGLDVALIEEGRRPRIVVAEDHDDVRGFIRGLLESHCDVEEATDGVEALERVRRNPPDLVVSDVMMPRLSGTELCKFIKADRKLRTVPVILLTARVGSEATLEAYAHGADDFVAKPFHPRVLIARIRAQLRLRSLALQVAQTERLAVVGTLAAGVLHEIRNPLNAIINAARVLTGRSRDDSQETELLSVIGDGASRIEQIAQALDAHARPAESTEIQPCDVREGIEATLALLEHKSSGVNFRCQFETDRHALVASGPLNQVFLNLLDNAINAGAENVDVSVSLMRDQIRVEFADDGPGVSEEHARYIFDPFFTKRTDGSGTGLGLYLSRKIVTDQGGSLWYEPRPGGGALFVVVIPSIQSAAARSATSGSTVVSSNDSIA